MQPTGIAGIAVLAAIVLWAVSTQRRLAALDEQVNSAMSQIGVQLSGRFDALTALLEVTRDCTAQEGEELLDAVKAGRSAITARSLPGDVLRQEGVIARALDGIARAGEECPALKEHEGYGKAMGAVETFGGMVRTSRLLYNDGVARLNREIRMFPVSLIAGPLGFRQRDYLEEKAVGLDPRGAS